MISHPEIQTKVIDQVVGDAPFPTLDHKDQLPYVEAVIFEALRVSCLVFNLTPHQPTFHLENTSFLKGRA